MVLCINLLEKQVILGGPSFYSYRLETDTGKKNLLDNVKSFYRNTFPNDGIQEGYWYVYKDKTNN